MSTDDRRVVDLDAARTARAEHVGPAPGVVLVGEEYELSRELPMDAILAMAELIEGTDGKTPDPAIVTSALKQLFGDTWETLRPKLSVSDCMYLLTGLLELYGSTLPESSASASS